MPNAPNDRAERLFQILNDANTSLSESDRREKYVRMSQSVLSFYRGSNQVFWADFCGDEQQRATLNRFGDSDTRTWLQGDLHPYNFGSYHNSDNDLVYNVNDFDDAVIADYQFDLLRMAIGIELVGEVNITLRGDDRRAGVEAFIEEYLDTVAKFAKDPDRGKPAETVDNTGGDLNRFLKFVRDEYTRKGMLKRWRRRSRANASWMWLAILSSRLIKTNGSESKPPCPATSKR